MIFAYDDSRSVPDSPRPHAGLADSFAVVPRLRKGLGQHHLRYGHLCRPAIDFLRPAGSTVIEIGPGGGILTRELLAVGAEVTAWEVDPAWAFELTRRGGFAKVRVVVGDARRLPWHRLRPGTLVAGNLPYAVATNIIESLLMTGAEVERAAFLVQEEVARRMTSRPGVKSYGLLSVMVQALSDARVLASLDPGSFRPAPRVGGAFVGLERREPPLPLAEMSSFRETVSAAFSHRRKTLANSLAEVWGKEAAVRRIEAAGLDGSLRAERLEVAELVSLHLAGECARSTFGG